MILYIDSFEVGNDYIQIVMKEIKEIIVYLKDYKKEYYIYQLKVIDG